MALRNRVGDLQVCTHLLLRGVCTWEGSGSGPTHPFVSGRKGREEEMQHQTHPQRGITPDQMGILMPPAVGSPGLLPILFSGIATARAASRTGSIAFCSTLRLLPITTVVSGALVGQ